MVLDAQKMQALVDFDLDNFPSIEFENSHPVLFLTTEPDDISILNTVDN